VLIPSTSTFGTACVTTLIDTTAFAGAPAFGGTLAPDASPTLDTNFVWEEVAFDEATPALFGAVGAFGAAPVLFSVTGSFRVVAF
jgi:hypothetical protein